MRFLGGSLFCGHTVHQLTVLCIQVHLTIKKHNDETTKDLFKINNVGSDDSCRKSNFFRWLQRKHIDVRYKGSRKEGRITPIFAHYDCDITFCHTPHFRRLFPLPTKVNFDQIKCLDRIRWWKRRNSIVYLTLNLKL